MTDPSRTAELSDVLRGPAGAWLLRLIANDPRACHLVNALASRDLDRRKTNGLPWPAGARAALAALAERADTPGRSDLGSDSGTGPATVITGPWLDPAAEAAGLVSVAEAARLVEKSEGYVRRLARLGRVRRFRAGRAWLVDLDSLRSVLARRAA